MRAWVPTAICVSPEASRSARLPRAPAPLRAEAVTSSTRYGVAREQPAEGQEVLLGQDLGGGHERGLVAVLHARPPSASSATIVLPEPTSPCTSRFIGCGALHVVGDLAQHALLRLGQAEGQDLLHRLARAVGDLEGGALGPLAAPLRACRARPSWNRNSSSRMSRTCAGLRARSARRRSRLVGDGGRGAGPRRGRSRRARARTSSGSVSGSVARQRAASWRDHAPQPLAR